MAKMIEMPLENVDSGGPKEPCIRWGPDPPVEKSSFEGAHCNLPTHEYTVHCMLPPRVNVPAHRTRRTNAFAAVGGDRMAMRSFAKLVLTLIRFV